MKLMNQKLRFNLQMFADESGADGADDGADSTNDADGDDNQDDKSKESGKKGFTQEEVDKMIADRLKRERAKEKRAKEKAEADKSRTPEDKKAEADKEQAAKVSALEAKLLCFEHDVAKESVTDVVALAKAYIDEDTDFEAAIEKVIKKYPQFVKGAKSSNDDEEEEGNNSKSWGKRQNGSPKKQDGVEAAFLAKNPGLKID
ncbi:hypothetical protein [Anaerosporobacter faecicola]|uniref:hypothetical protein n=1 Tax=Anaerosporobacter faecicola TaxID=2718714 RepID=UPI001438BDB0|nr:hypothetical protein [Anaerosporobacter faecicola]